MEYLSRDQIIYDLQQRFETYIEEFGIDDIGIFEEEGQDERYYIGYTVKKNGKTYHIHTPYSKNNYGSLAPIDHEWTVESDDPTGDDRRGYPDLESVMNEI